jgi:hypothetical protein
MLTEVMLEDMMWDTGGTFFYNGVFNGGSTLSALSI